MSDAMIHIKELPDLVDPVLIAGFDGWGNALNVSNGMAAYLVRELNARHFADLDPDAFYRYDEQRPVVDIEEGHLDTLTAPGGAFYAVKTAEEQSDLIILKANEPNLQWFKFVDQLFSLCRNLGVRTVITLGSMYDNVLHTDRVLSAVASTPEALSRLSKKRINSITYHGPSAIHSIIQSEGTQRGFECTSLWTHCPYYLQGATHFGILSYLGRMIAEIANFHLNTEDLDDNWKTLEAQIDKLVENNAELQSLIGNLRKEKVKGSTANLRGAAKSDEKVIKLQDFLDPK